MYLAGTHGAHCRGRNRRHAHPRALPSRPARAAVLHPGRSGRQGGPPDQGGGIAAAGKLRPLTPSSAPKRGPWTCLALHPWSPPAWRTPSRRYVQCIEGVFLSVLWNHNFWCPPDTRKFQQAEVRSEESLTILPSFCRKAYLAGRPCCRNNYSLINKYTSARNVWES